MSLTARDDVGGGKEDLKNYLISKFGMTYEDREELSGLVDSTEVSALAQSIIEVAHKEEVLAKAGKAM